MSEIVGGLAIQIELDRTLLDRELKNLESLKDRQLAFAASLDTRALRQQVNSLGQLKPTIDASIRLTNINAVEQQLRVLRRDRSLKIGVAIDESKLVNFEQRLKGYADRSFKVTAEVDDRQLTALNKHLDLKQKHFGQVSNYFKSNKLTPLADLSHLDALDRRLSELKNTTITVNATVKYANTQPPNIAQTVTQKLQVDTGDFEKSIGNSVEKAFKQVKGGGLLSGVGSLVSAPLKLAASGIAGVVGSIGAGLVFGITQPISQNLGKGVSAAIELALSKSVGSSELLGQKLSQSLGRTLQKGVVKGLDNLPSVVASQIAAFGDKLNLPSGVTKKLTRQLKRDLEEQIKELRSLGKDVGQAVTGAVGADGVQEGLAVRGRTAQRRREKRGVARTQAVSEQRNAVDAQESLRQQFQQTQERSLSELPQLQKQLQQLRRQIKDIQAKAQKAQKTGDTGQLKQLLTDYQLAAIELQQVSDDRAFLSQFQPKRIAKLRSRQESLQSRINTAEQERESLLSETPKNAKEQEKITQRFGDVTAEIAGLQEKLARTNKSLSLVDAPTQRAQQRVDSSIERTQKLDKGAQSDQLKERFNESLQKQEAGLIKAVEGLKNAIAKTSSELDAAKQSGDIESAVPLFKRKKVQEADLAEAQRRLSSSQEQLRLRALPSIVQAGSAVSPTPASTPKVIPLPRVLDRILDETAQISGVKIPEGRKPQLSISREIKGTGQYDPDRNVVGVNPEVAKQVLSGNITEEIAGIFVHEFRHAIQAAFGQADAFSGSAAVPLLKPTQEDLQNAPVTRGRTLAERIEGSTALAEERNPNATSRAGKAARRLEADAYTFEARNTKPIYQKISKESEIEETLQVGGVGGQKIREAYKSLQSVVGEIGAEAKAAGLNIATSLGQEVAEISQIGGRLKPLLAKVTELDLLPVDEIQQIQQEFKRELAEIDQAKGRLKGILAAEYENKLIGQAVQNPLDSGSVDPDALQRFFDRSLASTSQGTAQPKYQIEDPFEPPKSIQRRAVEAGQSAANALAEGAGKAKGVLFNPDREIAIDMDKLGAIAAQTGAALRSVHDGSKKVVSVFRVMANSDAAQSLIGGVGGATRGLLAVSKTTLKLASGLEAIALDALPFGRTIKGTLQQTALPAATFAAATHLLPGGTVAAQGLGNLVSGVASPLIQSAGSTLAGQAAGFAAHAVPNILGLQGSVSGAVGSAVSGAVGSIGEIAIQAGTVILGGKLLQGTVGNAGKAALKSALPEDSPKALPGSTVRALPAAKVESAALSTEIVSDPFQGLTRPQLLKSAQKLGIKGVNSKTTKDVLIDRLKGFSDQSEVDRVLDRVRGEIGRDGKPTAGFNLSAEKEALKRLSVAEKSINKKLSQMQAASGAKREKLINEVLLETQSAIVEIDKLKGENLSGETRRSLSGTQGRIENTVRNNPLLNEARTERSQIVQQSSNASRERNITGLARVAEPEVATLGTALRNGFRKLTNFAAKQFDVTPQPTIKQTLGAISRSPKAKSLATDLAVNGAGFAASQLGSQHGTVPGLAGDLIGALAARTAINRGRPSGRDLTGDVSGFAIGNGFSGLANAGLDALSGVVPGAGILRAIPFKGAIAAAATVPRIVEARERRIAAPKVEGLARTQSQGVFGGLADKFRSLLPNQQIQADRLKRNYEAIYREIAGLSQVAFDPKNLPRLEVNAAKLKQSGNQAFYDIERNVITIDDTIARILGKKAEALSRHKDKLSPLVHEGRHSVQLDNGRLSLEAAASGKAVNLSDDRGLNSKQRTQLVGSVNAARAQGASKSQSASVKILEADAYAFESNTSLILSRVAPQSTGGLLQRLSNGVQGFFSEINGLARDAIAAIPRPKSSGQTQKLQSQIDSALQEVEGQIQNFDKLGDALNRQLGEFERQVRANAKFEQMDSDRELGGLQKNFSIRAATPEETRKLRQFDREVARTNPSKDAQNLSQGVSGAARTIAEASQDSDRLGSSLGRLGGFAKNAIAGFIGFQILSNIIPQLQQFATASVQATIKLDNLKTALSFATGSSASGAKELAFVRSEVDRLGVPLGAAQEGFVKLAASTKGTSLSGATTRELFTGISSAATVLGLSADEANGSYLALSQIASKGKVQAEELRGQLGERIPGAFSIAARAMGVTEGELNKLLETGSVMASDFLPKFAKQLQQEFGGSAEAASKNLQSSVFRMQNAMQKLQESTGAAIAPAALVGVQTLTVGLNALATNGQQIAQTFLILGGIIGVQLLGGLAKVPIVSKLIGLSIAEIGVGLKALAPVLAKLALQFLVVNAAIELGRSLFEQFVPSDVGNQFKGFADQGESNLKRIEDAANKARGAVEAIPDKPKKSTSKGFDLTLGAGEALGLGTFKTDDYVKFARDLPGLKQGREAISNLTGGRVNLGTTVEEIQKQRDDEQFDRFRTTTQDLVGKGFDSRSVASSLRKVQGFDQQLEGLRNQRSSLSSGGNPDKSKLAALDKQEKALSEEREKAANPVTSLSNGITSQLANARAALTNPDISETDKGKLQNDIKLLEQAEANVNKITSAIKSSTSAAKDLNKIFLESAVRLETIAEKNNEAFKQRQIGNTKQRIKTFGTDVDASIVNPVVDAGDARDKAKSDFEANRFELEKLAKEINQPANTALLSGIKDSSGKALTTESSVSELEDAKKGLTDKQADKKNIVDRLIDFKKNRQKLTDLEGEFQDKELALVKAKEAAKLAAIDKASAQRESRIKRQEANATVGLVRKKIGKNASEEDLAIEEAGIAQNSANARMASTQQELAEVQNAFKQKLISAEEYEKKRRGLEDSLSDATVRQAQAELAVVEAKNRKILEGYDRISKRANAAINTEFSERTNSSKLNQLNGRGLTGEGGQSEVLAAEIDASVARLNLKDKEFAQVQELRNKGVISEKEAEDRRMQITADTQQLESQVIEQITQQKLRAIQNEVDAQKRSTDEKVALLDREKSAQDQSIAQLEKRKSLLDAELGVIKAISESRQSALKIGVDRASESADLFKQVGGLKSEKDTQTFQRENVLRSQLSEFGLNPDDEQGIIGAIQNKQALEFEADAERTAALLKQQELERESVRLGLLKEQSSARIAVIEARRAELLAKQNLNAAKGELSKALKTGDRNEIANAQSSVDLAQEGISLAAQGTGLAQGNVGAIDERLQKELQANDIRAAQARSELDAENQAKKRQRDRELATTADEVKYRGGLNFSGVAPSAVAQANFNPIEVAGIQPQTSNVDQAVSRASNNQDVVAKLEQLYAGIIQLANSPRSLSFSTPTPVEDYAKYQNEQAGSTLRGL